MKKLFYSLFLIIMFFSSNAFGQNIPCMPDYTGFYDVFQIPDSYPKFYTDMPLDVMITYIALDSASKYGDYKEISRFAKRLKTSNDSLKYLRRFYYQVIDYDPILFEEYRFYQHPDSNIVYPNFGLINNLYDAIDNNLYKNLKNDIEFFTSSAICHVRALNVEKRINNAASRAKTEIGICCEVIDKIKGQKLHSACSFPQFKTVGKSLQNNPEYLSFTYCAEWGLLDSSSDDIYFDMTAGMKYGDSLLVPGKEYIVFLGYSAICSESNIAYFNYVINLGNKKNFILFPIENGIVQDEHNYFGFGTGLTTAEFKNKLRERIQQIKEMRY